MARTRCSTRCHRILRQCGLAAPHVRPGRQHRNAQSLVHVVRVDLASGRPISKALSSLPNHYNHNEAYTRYKAAREATVDLLLKVAPGVKQLLTAEQRRKLPDIVTSSLDSWYLSSIRSGTAGSSANPFSATAGAIGGGGGAQTITIVR